MKRHPELGVKGYLMALDGSVEKLVRQAAAPGWGPPRSEGHRSEGNRAFHLENTVDHGLRAAHEFKGQG